MKDTEFAYAVARVRSNEHHLLTPAELEQVLSSGSEKNALTILAQKGWTSGEKMLSAEQKKLWDFIFEITPDQRLFDALLISNDFHNLKASIKCFVSSHNPKGLFLTPSVYKHEDIWDKVKNADFESLPECMRDCAEKAYTALLERSDAQICDCVIDRAGIEYALSLAKAQGGLLFEIIRLRAFTANFKTACRCLSQGKDGAFILDALAECDGIDRQKLAQAASEGLESITDLLASYDKPAAQALSSSLGEFERLEEEKELSLCRGARFNPFGTDPLTAFIVLRQSDIRNVRIILTAQRNGIYSDRARSMLRTAKQ